MKKKIYRYILFIFLITSCSIKPKLSPIQRYKEAMELYKKKEYGAASTIFKEIRIPLIGKNEEIEVVYYLAMCYFHREENILAADYFKDFFDTFPTTDKAEEALFLEGESLYKESPYSNLDQSITHSAMESLNLYITNFPKGKFLEKANRYYFELKTKLAKKDFDNLCLFYNLGYYSATVTYCKNFEIDHIDSDLQAEVLFIKIMSLYKLYEKNKSNLDSAAEFHLNILKETTKFSNLYSNNNHIVEVTNIEHKFINPAYT